MTAAFERRGDALILKVHVQPRAAKTEYAGRHGARIKIRLHAPPVDGEANRVLIKWLAAEFGVPAAAVQLLSGATHRDKRLAIAGPRQVPAWLADYR